MEDNLEENMMDPENSYPRIDVARSRYPYCIVWTPIPVLTWVARIYTEALIIVDKDWCIF